MATDPYVNEIMNRRKFISATALAGVGLAMPGAHGATRHHAPEIIRIGIIGLDTSHSPAFTKYFNVTDTSGKFRVVSAYPHGSADIESSVSRIPKYTEEVRALGVKIAGSIGEVLENCDAVLLETNDGRLHKQQAFEVIEARKPLFIDKPVAANLSDVIAIYEKAQNANVPLFSSSSLRYSAECQQVRSENAIGKVVGADTFSPATIEPHHADLFWYGIHGVEMLFTVMGTGCESVTRIAGENCDVVVGVWSDGRIGVFRGMREGQHAYGGTAFGQNTNVVLKAPADGYEGLLRRIANFFETRTPPVDAAETIEIYAFMQAADESKRKGGAAVLLADLMK